MSAKEDVLRALQYGKTAEYNAIIAQPSYQAELARVRTDYNERTWIDFKGFYPKFPTAEFIERREQYQAKYGNTVNIPGFTQVLHITPAVAITPEQRAAHLWASKRGLPSPLTQPQLDALKYKKFRFLKALASATPSWMLNYGAVATMLDNIEDALVTVTVLGRIAVKAAPRLLGRLIPGLGWVLLGADILNAANIVSYITMAAKKAKRSIEALAEKNPFHAKAAANRAQRLTKALPGFGEFLEILQTTDQLFGVGLCLGGLMGMVNDLMAKAITWTPYNAFEAMPKTGTRDELTAWSYKVHATRAADIKAGIIAIWSDAKNDAARLKASETELARKIFDFSANSAAIVWNKLTTLPDQSTTPYSDALLGAMILSTGKDDFTNDDHTKALLSLDGAINGLMPWWIKNNPLEAFHDIRTFQFRLPEPKDPITIDMLDQRDPNWRSSLRWPHINKEYATIEDITLAYAPMIKDSFQTYALRNNHDYTAMIAGQQVVEFTKDIIRTFSDDHDVTVGMTAWWASAEDMMRDIYLIPPDTPGATISLLADYIRQHERLTTQPPAIKDLARFGTSIGIDWMRTFPIRAFNAAAEILPDWQIIQDQLNDLYVID